MKIFFDGSGWSPKTKKSGYAVVFDDSSKSPIVKWFGEKKTSNEMEYAAFIEALQKARDGDELVGDSQLVERQLKSEYQVKAENLKPLFKEAKALMAAKNVSVTWVERGQNEAGKLVQKLVRKRH